MIGRAKDRSDDAAAWHSLAEDAYEDEDGRLCDEDGDPIQVHDELVPYVDLLRDRARNRIDAYHVHNAIYEGLSLLRPRHEEALRLVRVNGIPEQQLNFAKNVKDAIHVKVTKNRPAVKVVVSDADYSYVNRARKLTRAIAGEFDATELHSKVNDMAHVAEIDGTGFVKVYTDWDAKRVAAEVVPPDEIFVDDVEGRYGCPRQMHQVKQYSRERLVADFPEHEQAILDAPASQLASDFDPDGGSEDLVDVYEGWKLPSRRFEDDELSDGRRYICVHGATLLLEDYRRDRFPVVAFRWRQPAVGRGFWGSGVIAEVQRTQWEIDKLVGEIQKALRRGSRFKILVNRGGDVDDNELEDPSPGGIIHWGPGGNPPQVVAPDPVSQQLFTYLQFLIDKIYQTAGMSQDAAQSNKPAGLNSGIALLHFHDFQTERFLDQARRLNEVYIDLASLYVDCMKELAEEEGYRVRWSDGDVIQEIDWSRVDMERDRFVLKLESVSEFPDTYSGQLSIITQLAQNGQVPDSYVSALFENPDLWRLYRTRNSDWNHTQWIIERLSDEEEEGLPVVDPAQNTEMVIDLVGAALKDADRLKAPPAILDKFRDYLKLQEEMLEKKRKASGGGGQPPPQGMPPMGPPPGGGPGGPPMPPMPV